MQQTQWSMQLIKQCEKETGQAMLKDEQTLVSYSQDFGRVVQSNPAVVSIPENPEKIQAILSYANQNNLAVTLRGKGLSQGGQSLALQGGLTLHLEQLNRSLDKESEAIWMEANSTWSQLLDCSLKTAQIPFVLPYNCNLSIGGVLSAAGIGASSFKHGSVNSHVKALEVILANGSLMRVDEHSELFNACLSGQGRFGVITKACIKLRKCHPKVRTFFLVYLDKDLWFNDLEEMKKKADYIEAFCSPSIQGMKAVAGIHIPFAKWLFALHVSVEYDKNPPELADIFKGAAPLQILHQQDEPIHAYLHRHDSRFEAMKLTGLWDLVHPWYECFMSKSKACASIDELLEELPIYYASLLQVVPLANKQQTGFFMLPKTEEVYELMILNPGINPVLVPGCLKVIAELDAKFLKEGGKRYLSGFIGSHLDENYWRNHFGDFYADWVGLKKKYDPKNVLGSYLYGSTS